jgi:hypothetical protein
MDTPWVPVRTRCMQYLEVMLLKYRLIPFEIATLDNEQDVLKSHVSVELNALAE